MKITADFGRLTNREIRPMHGVGQPPMLGLNDSRMHYLKEAGIPFSRLHDAGGNYGDDMFVDVPNIFRNFDADENDPASYSFAFTDAYIAAIVKRGVEPIYRLGVTIENFQHYEMRRLAPPKDFSKWARVCGNIIAHYNEGWANGFHYGIRYWEIWNEPDNNFYLKWNEMWKGTPEQYFELYDVTARHLKERFGGSIRVGGFASCGFYACGDDPDCKGIDRPVDDGLEGPQITQSYRLWFAHEFLKYVAAHKSPLDFFSWHSYSTVHDMMKHADYCRRLLARYGFDDVEDMLNEWNPVHDPDLRDSALSASNVMACMLAMQKMRVGSMEYYDARIEFSSYGGLFDPGTWRPVKAYYAMMAFNDLYKLKGEIETASDDDNVFVGGATNGKKNALLIANVSDKPVDAEIALVGADMSDVDIFMIDDHHQYTPTGMTLEEGRLTLPKHSVVEIRTMK